MEPKRVDNNLVVSMDYELTVDNAVIDSSEENDPIVFLQGVGNIVPGLEKAIQGMKVGETKEVEVKAAEAYGVFDPENFIEVPKNEFPEDIPLEVGTEIGVNDENGDELTAYIEEVDLEKITLNFNHPLAGKDLKFKVKITDIREATAEELEHGHIHFDEHECHCGEGGDCCGEHDGECCGGENGGACSCGDK
jgi:FKBP-type peptidyl-prolyl cis-trans isomerase SlyD